MSLDGETVYRGTATGALSELVVVDERVALPTGGGIPLEQAALLGCAALTGVGAVLFAARVEAGSSVLVVGAGGVGQFVIQGARIAGAAAIIVVDPLPERRAQALGSGATHAAAPDEIAEALRDAGVRGADYAFDAVGDPATTTLALRHTGNGGTCVIVGLPAAGKRLDIDPAELIRREKRLTGTMYGSEDPAVAMPVLLGHVREGRLDLASLVGRSFPLDELNEAFAASDGGEPGGCSCGRQGERGDGRLQVRAKGRRSVRKAAGPCEAASAMREYATKTYAAPSQRCRGSAATK